MIEFSPLSQQFCETLLPYAYLLRLSVKNNDKEQLCVSAILEAFENDIQSQQGKAARVDSRLRARLGKYDNIINYVV